MKINSGQLGVINKAKTFLKTCLLKPLWQLLLPNFALQKILPKEPSV